MWPIDGGNLLIKETTTYDLLITGHEDGSVKFWDIRSGENYCMHQHLFNNNNKS